MLGGLLTANPVVTIGMFAGTVLTSVGSLIVFTGREKKRIKELEQHVTDMLLGLEEEFERCQRNMAMMNGEGQGIDQIRANLDNALIGRAMTGSGGMNLDTITRILTNIQRFSTNMRSRLVFKYYLVF